MALVKERKALKMISNYTPARTIESVCKTYGVNSIVKLAGNENRLGCSSKVVEALLENRNQFSYYPDSNYTVLRGKLSAIHNIDGENLIFGNGSFELISLVAQAYLEQKSESIIPTPSFGWYKNVTLQADAKPVLIPLKNYGVDLQGIKAAVTDKTKVIWICNPNNPTGTVLPVDELLTFIEEVPKHILVVLDEAYVDFIDSEYLDTVELVRKHRNVILLRTFSKLYGLASLRIGYGIAADEVTSNLQKVRLPVNVNYAAVLAAEVSLEDSEFKEKVLKANREGLRYYYLELDKLQLKYIKSNGNFLLVKIGLDGKYVEAEFLKRGYMIRNGEEFGLDGFIRISIGRKEENERVIEILKEILIRPKA